MEGGGAWYRAFFSSSRFATIESEQKSTRSFMHGGESWEGNPATRHASASGGLQKQNRVLQVSGNAMQRNRSLTAPVCRPPSAGETVRKKVGRVKASAFRVSVRRV